MKKITEVTGLNGKQKTLAEIAEEYFIENNQIYTGKIIEDGKEIKPQKQIIDAIQYVRKNSILGRLAYKLKENSINPHLKRLLIFFFGKRNHTKHLRKFILSSPLQIVKYIKIIESFKQKHNIDFGSYENPTDEGKIIQYIFDYDKLDKSWLGKKLNIKVCPYCNNQYTQTLEKTDKTHKVQFQLDHFYPKSIYPYLAISFYNLIPSCANCNLSKSNHDTFKDNLIHPYEESFHHVAKFRTKASSDKELVKDFLEKGDFRAKNIDIELFSTDKRVEQHKNIFHLEDIYRQHQDVVAEIYTKSYLYPSTRIDELKNMFNDSKLSLFSEEELKRFVLGNYTDEKDFHLRPLAKLTHDIAKELGLL